MGPCLPPTTIAQRPRGRMVIDLFGLSVDDVRLKFPEVYQHLLVTVKPERDLNNRESYRLNWWIFGEPRRELRPALDGLQRYITTVDTARHRVFQFLPAKVICDDKSVIIASDDAFLIGVLPPRPGLSMPAASRHGSSERRRPKRRSAKCWPHWRGLAMSRRMMAIPLRCGGSPESKYAGAKSSRQTGSNHQPEIPQTPQ